MSSTAALSFVIVAAVGAAIGSFLNVVILRTHQEKSWLSGRSACPHCGHVLRWYDLIPIGSFVLLGGRCRYCRHSLAQQYVIVETLTAAAFVIAYIYGGVSWLTVISWVTLSAMILLAVYDARWSLLPDAFSLIFSAAAILVSWALGRTWQDVVLGGLIGAVFFGLQYILSRRQWVGSGDILLGLGLGLLLGWRLLLLALFLAYLSGAVVAGVMMVARKVKSSSTIAFGPYLLAGGGVSWFWGERIVNWYFQHAIFR